MEITRVLRGENTGFASSAHPAEKAEKRTEGTGRSSVDRLELTQQLVQVMEEQSARIQALLPRPGEEDQDSGGLLGYMETEEDKLDALSEELDVQMKCLKIAMNIMKGKKVPPEDERYLMEHDPDGYKLAMAMKLLAKEDKKECESVLDDEDKNGDKTEESSDSGEPAPAEAAPDSGGETE